MSTPTHSPVSDGSSSSSSSSLAVCSVATTDCLPLESVKLLSRTELEPHLATPEMVSFNSMSMKAKEQFLHMVSLYGKEDVFCRLFGIEMFYDYFTKVSQPPLTFSQYVIQAFAAQKISPTIARMKSLLLEPILPANMDVLKPLCEKVNRWSMFTPVCDLPDTLLALDTLAIQLLSCIVYKFPKPFYQTFGVRAIVIDKLHNPDSLSTTETSRLNMSIPEFLARLIDGAKPICDKRLLKPFVKRFYGDIEY